ncbi:flagellin [Actinoplanes sp. NPDC020271]|uniref:flagellin N-terminal helical domain-containing protein n=1 Tax=Actinoplanes sp. NPDC020271 TaxID=3363896 RepID=UPI0037B18B85
MRTRTMASLQRNLNASQKAQDQISSGKQLTRPSDSPTGTVTALQLRGEVRANKKYSTNADDAAGRLGVVQDNLQHTQELTTVARNLLLEAASSGGGGTKEANEARAAQLEQLKANMVQFANSKYLDRPVFGGSTPDSSAYDATGQYIGESAGETLRAIGPNAKVRVDVRGSEAYGPDYLVDAGGGFVDATGAPVDDAHKVRNPAQLFHVMDDAIAALRSGDNDALTASMKNLDKASDLVKSTLSDVGARYNRVTQMKQSAEDRLMSVSSQLSDIEDVDLPKAIMELQLQQTSYQAALAATAKVIQPSLIDFLR